MAKRQVSGKRFIPSGPAAVPPLAGTVALWQGGSTEASLLHWWPRMPGDFMEVGWSGSSSAAPPPCGSVGSGSVPRAGLPQRSCAGPSPRHLGGIFHLSGRTTSQVLHWAVPPQANTYSGFFFERTVPSVAVKAVFLSLKNATWGITETNAFLYLGCNLGVKLYPVRATKALKQFTCIYSNYIFHFCLLDMYLSSRNFKLKLSCV